jgi:hypothetical protein
VKVDLDVQNCWRMLGMVVLGIVKKNGLDMEDPVAEDGIRLWQMAGRSSRTDSAAGRVSEEVSDALEKNER